MSVLWKVIKQLNSTLPAAGISGLIKNSIFIHNFRCNLTFKSLQDDVSVIEGGTSALLIKKSWRLFQEGREW